jgi:hypothetical protein
MFVFDFNDGIIQQKQIVGDGLTTCLRPGVIYVLSMFFRHLVGQAPPPDGLTTSRPSALHD